MKDISIRSTQVLVTLALIAIGLMFLVEFTKKERQQAYFEEKLEAANLMQNCISYLKEIYFKNEVSIDNINDPNESCIIGTRYSEITSGRGSLPIKLSTVNPNFAALVIQLYKDAGLKSGDHIAICATGSFPALNIAACSAAKVLKLKVSLISSLTSSSWGANDPNYTFPDMYSTLQEGGFLNQNIIAASIGANQDIGRTLTPKGRDLAVEAIERNNIPFIDGSSLEQNIKKRMQLFEEREKETGQIIKLYVNIGGGVASLGGPENSNQLPPGLTKTAKLSMFPDKKGIMFEMAAKNIPFINLLNLSKLMNKYELPIDPVPLPDFGEGKLFKELKYDLRIVIGSTLLLVLLMVGVIIYDKRQNV